MPRAGGDLGNAEAAEILPTVQFCIFHRFSASQRYHQLNSESRGLCSILRVFKLFIPRETVVMYIRQIEFAQHNAINAYERSAATRIWG